MSFTVFVDGQEGTTGLRIHEYLAQRRDVEVLRIDANLRKDNAERARLLNAADVAFLCLPDAAAPALGLTGRRRCASCSPMPRPKARPAASPMPWDTVIELDLDGPAQSKPGLTGEINGGGWHLGPATATLDGLKAHPGDKFWLPAHLSGFERDSPPATATWSVSFPAAGEYPLNVCLACPDAETEGRLVLALDGIPVASGVPIRGTAPDATEFRTFTLPPLKITSPGTHVLTVRSAKAASKNLRIAWLHIAPQS